MRQTWKVERSVGYLLDAARSKLAWLQTAHSELANIEATNLCAAQRQEYADRCTEFSTWIEIFESDLEDKILTLDFEDYQYFFR